jgi:hypothetical protein
MTANENGISLIHFLRIIEFFIYTFVVAVRLIIKVESMHDCLQALTSMDLCIF